MINVNELRIQYGEFTAVDGVTFEVRRNECFGLLGPNGAGKTTTFSALVGLLHPTGGAVLLDGAHDPREAAVRRRVGIAPQALALYDELTAHENIEFFGRMYGLRGGELRERVRASLEFVGLQDRAGSPAKTYSGGMMRRLNLACGIVHDPELVLLDEPTVGVDPQSRNQIFANIEELKRRGKTIVYTTHYMEEVERLCDRVLIMDRGRVLDLGTVPALIARHGGGSAVTAELAAPPPQGAELPGVLSGDTLRVPTNDALATIRDLDTRGLKIRRLSVEQPSLEDVFLNLTGRSLRD
ncbi:MAG: ABC transporter ATP-binding protein [Candidatus Sumerlaeia bacterium]|nr:ABC transporter ATP-binding protein [Candidatus Sumerlaeia bacterium]